MVPLALAPEAKSAVVPLALTASSTSAAPLPHASVLSAPTPSSPDAPREAASGGRDQEVHFGLPGLEDWLQLAVLAEATATI